MITLIATLSYIAVCLAPQTKRIAIRISRDNAQRLLDSGEWSL